MEELLEASRGLNKAQKKAVEFFKKMHHEEIVSLQPVRIYQYLNKEETRRMLEAGRYFHPFNTSTRIKSWCPKFSELFLIWTISGYLLKLPINYDTGHLIEADLI